MKIKEVLIRPWEKDEIRIIKDVYIDDDWQSDKIAMQTWEIIGEGKPPGTQIKIFTDHPIL